MPGKGTPIFIVTIRDLGNDNFEVYGENAAAEAGRVQFVRGSVFDENLKKLHDRDGFGFVTVTQHDDGCSAIGEHLFKSFFGGSVLARYRNYRDRNPDYPRIALQIPQSLYYLPWEVIRDPKDNPGQYLAMQGSLIRYDSQEPKPEDRVFADIPENHTHLFLLASTRDKPIGPFDPADWGSVKFLPVTPAAFRKFGELLKRTKPYPFGLVFFGHGKIQGNQGYLLFVKPSYEPDPIAGFVVARAIGEIKAMRVAYILACDSAWAAE